MTGVQTCALPISVEDVLTAQTGLTWTWNTDGSGILRSDDWLQYVLDKPIGDRVGYALQAHAYLMSAIVQTVVRNATGSDALALAQERLFDPLGISDVTWDISPDGAPSHLGLHLKMRDMTKWGHLYLNQGACDDQQIVPADWVAASTISQMETAFEDQFLSFGYLMNVYDLGAYAAQGTDWSGVNGTAAIVVMPEIDVVFAFNIVKRVNGCQMIKNFCDYYIMPAAVSDEPLPENPEALAELNTLIEAVAADA